MLKLSGRRCIVLGGGLVAERRARSLLAAGAAVTVIAPQITGGLGELAVTHAARRFQAGDLAGAFLAVLATDEPAVHDAAAAEARRAGVLINRCDAPDQGDLTVPAHAHHGPVTIAVDTSGISAAASAAIRRELSDALDLDWPRLLELARPFRERLQQQEPDSGRRKAKLRRLTDQQAMAMLKTQGPEAVTMHFERIVVGPADAETSDTGDAHL